MKHNRAAAPAWPVSRHTFAGTRGNGGGVTLQFLEVFERFVKNPDIAHPGRLSMSAMAVHNIYYRVSLFVCHRQSEDRAIAAGSAAGGCSVESAVGRLRHPADGIPPVPAVEAVQSG